jgi:hypothetical protein
MLRFPGLFYPLGPDEAGVTLVARAWDPASASLYGDYWLDRSPVLLALVKVSDLVGGPLFLRAVAAIGCAVLVLAAAATARALLHYARVTDQRTVNRTGAWTAVLTAAVTSSAMIDPIMAKGEVLGIPFVVVSFWLVLEAVNRPRPDAVADGLAAVAGLAGCLAVGMKQNLFAGLLFAAGVLVGSRLTGHLTGRGLRRLGGSALVGAAVPLGATLAWAGWAAVPADDLWFAVYGFRFEALGVLSAGATAASLERALLLPAIAIATGAALPLVGAVVHARRLWGLDPILTLVTASVVTVDLAGLVLGGSYWRQYLFVLVPGLVLCTALLLAVHDQIARRIRVLVVAAAVCSVTSSLVWVLAFQAGMAPAIEVSSGRAVAAAAEPGDTIVSYGGHPDLVWASGLESPYPYLWSLQMRTMDPRLTELRVVLSGPGAPTWVVMSAPGYSWDDLAEPIRPVLDARYTVHGRVCRGRYVYLLNDVARPPLAPAC